MINEQYIFLRPIICKITTLVKFMSTRRPTSGKRACKGLALADFKVCRLGIFVILPLHISLYMIYLN